MAAQDNNIAISQPAYDASLTALTLVNEKERKKQQEELLKLVSALKTVEEAVAGGKAVATKEGGKIVSLKTPEEASSSSSSGGVSSDEMAEMMAELALALQTLQVNITKAGQEKATYDANIAQIQNEVAKTNLDNAIKQIQKSESESWWQKLIGWIVAVVSAIAAIVTFNPELLVITAISVMAATGLLSKITEGITDVLEKIMPADVAKVIAAVIVIVVIMICSLGTGEGAAAEVVADTAVEDGVEMSNMAGEAVEDASAIGENAASNTSSFMEKVQAFFKKINLFNRLSLRANTFIVGAVQGIASTGLVNNIAQLIMDHTKMSKEEQEKIQEILSLIVAFITVIVSLGGTAASAEKATVQASSKLFQLSRNLSLVGGITQGVGQTAEGGLQIAQGVSEADLAKIKASMELLMVAMNMNNTNMNEDQKNDADIIKEQNAGNRSLTKLVAGEQGFTQLLTQYSPV
jgi:hypothetical protein